MTKSKTPIQDNIRRIKTLRDQNIQILDLDSFKRIEHKAKKSKPVIAEKTIRQKFISLFKLNGKT